MSGKHVAPGREVSGGRGVEKKWGLTCSPSVVYLLPLRVALAFAPAARQDAERVTCTKATRSSDGSDSSSTQTRKSVRCNSNWKYRTELKTFLVIVSVTLLGTHTKKSNNKIHI